VQVHGVAIDDTFAEAFPMWGTRTIITADTLGWAMHAARSMTGFATSVIACGCEAAIEGLWPDTPDGRPGISVLLFGITKKALDTLAVRIGQTVMTCPTTACFNGLDGTEHVRVGSALRYFGDGYQRSKRLDGRRLWRIPVMDGEFVVEDRFGAVQGIGGANFLVLGDDQMTTLRAAARAVRAARRVRGVALPFPGGIARSGSKPGSRYRFLRASTNHPYCPTVRSLVTSRLPDGVNAVYEIIIDALDEGAAREAMRQGMLAACQPGVLAISASNFGGALGPYRLSLREILAEVGGREDP
jgi:formylmethanofuran--tetrahydromethanopterin N-formyltransferase